jgi:hypothetical protein
MQRHTMSHKSRILAFPITHLNPCELFVGHAEKEKCVQGILTRWKSFMKIFRHEIFDIPVQNFDVCQGTYSHNVKHDYKQRTVISRLCYKIKLKCSVKAGYELSATVAGICEKSAMSAAETSPTINCTFRMYICMNMRLVSAWTVAVRFKAWTVFVRSNAGIVGSNPNQGTDVCAHLFCVCADLCAGSGLATGWSPVEGVLLTV